MDIIDSGDFDDTESAILVWTTSEIHNWDDAVWVVDLWIKRSYESEITNDFNVLYVKEECYE
jgi:hypothetical protein